LDDETKHSVYLDERQGFTELTAVSVLVGAWANWHSSSATITTAPNSGIKMGEQQCLNYWTLRLYCTMFTGHMLHWCSLY